MSAGRVRRGAAVAALMSTTILLPALAPVPALGVRGSHHHAPSQRQLNHAHRAVGRREHQIKVAAGRIGAARAGLAKLNVVAEVAAEAYDGAHVKLVTARQAAARAHLVLAGADRQVAAGQRQVVSFARAAYQSGGLSAISTYFAPGGPAKLVSRMGAIDAITTSEHTTLQRFEAAKIYQGVVSQQAAAVEAKATTAATAAAKTKAAATAAVARQTTMLAGLRRQQAHLRRLLSAAQAHADALQRAHLAAVARARRRAAARAAEAPAPAHPGHSPYSGASGSLAGTVPSAVGAAAVTSAESQIGKPYVWAAAGPDSYDCSGLTMWAYAQHGVQLDHWTGDQWNEGAHVSRAELRPGDLVFFAFDPANPSTIHHVGMYVGNGQMVDAPFTGADVRYDAAFRPDYIGAVRPYQR